MTEPIVKQSCAGTADFVDAAVAGIGLVPLFQPIVTLCDGKTVGYEALARWPSLAHLRPSVVFERAAASGRLAQLDQACTSAALSAALQAGLGPHQFLMINCEPGTAPLRCGDDELMERAGNELRLVFEITERSLLTHPKALLQKVAAMRSDRFAVALDDVGANPDSLALLDVLAPDIIKLDIDLVQSRLSDRGARICAGVLAHRERTGAVILAEGVETDAHLERALAVGATLGQGFRFGAAAPLSPGAPSSWSLPTGLRREQSIAGSPFDVVRHHSPVRTARRSTVLALSHHVESLATPAFDPPILLSALQHRKHFTETTRDRYRKLAERSVLVAVFGEMLPSDLGRGVRSVTLDSADPLGNEWTVIALGPHISAALIAREQPGSTGRNGDREFDMVLTYDRKLVTAAARALMYRLV